MNAVHGLSRRQMLNLGKGVVLLTLVAGCADEGPRWSPQYVPPQWRQLYGIFSFFPHASHLAIARGYVWHR